MKNFTLLLPGKKSIFSFCITIFLFAGYTGQAQIIVETFDLGNWTSTLSTFPVTGGSRSVAGSATSAAQTVSSWLRTGSTTGTTTGSTTISGATTNQAWTWYAGSATVTNVSATNNNAARVRSVVRGIRLNENQGYLITPVINAGISTVSFWMSSEGNSSVYVGYRALSGTVTSKSSVSAAFNRFTRSSSNMVYVNFPVTVTGNTGGAGVPSNGVSGGSFTHNNTVASQYTFSIPASAASIAGQLVFFDDSESSNFSNAIIDDIVITATVTGPPVILADQTGIAQTSNGNIGQNSTDNVLSNFRVNVTTSDAILNTLSFAAGGNFVAGDVTNFKLYTNTTTTFPGGSPISTVAATGIANGGTISFSGLTQACAVGDRYFFITADIPSGATLTNTVRVPATPSLTFAVSTPTNNITIGGLKTIVAPIPPVITLDHTNLAQTGAANVARTSVNNIVSNFRANVTSSNATLNSISFSAGGNFVTGDITNFKLYTSNTTAFPGGSPISTFSATGIAAGGTVTFSSLTQSCPIGDTYFWITADIAAAATVGLTVSVPATPTVTFALGSPTNNITAGGTKTIVSFTNYYNKTGATDAGLVASWTTDATGAATAPPANFTSGDKFTVRASTSIGLSTAWVVNGGVNTELIVNGTFTQGTSFNLAGALTVNGSFSNGNQTLTLGTNGSIGGTAVSTSASNGFNNITINTTSSSDIVTLNKSIFMQNGATVNINQGVLNVGSSNVITMGTNGGMTITTTANGNFATTNNNADAGTIDFGAGSGNVLTVNGPAKLYNIRSTGANADGNWRLNFVNTTAVIYGTLRVEGNQANQWAVQTSSPAWGPNSTFYFNKNNQSYVPGLEWISMASGTPGVTPGYPNNVTLLNMGTSVNNGAGFSPNGGAWSINGTLSIGDGVTAGSTFGIAEIARMTSFTCGGITINNGATLKHGAEILTVKGNWLQAGATTGVFSVNSGTNPVIFGGSGTSGSPQTITSTGSSTSITTMPGITISNGTYVKLNSPVTLPATGTFTLTSGILETDATGTNILSVTNPATAAITGAGIGSGSYINGPVKRTLLSSGTNSYTFPVAAGTTYLPLVLSSTNTIASNVATVQAFAANSGGNAGSGLSSISTSEYWSMATSSGLATTGTTVTVSRPSGSGTNTIAKSTTSNGTYTSAGGTANGTTGTTGDIATTSPWFFVFATATPANVVLANNPGGQVAAGNVSFGSTNNVIYNFQTAVTVNPATLNNVSFTTTAGAGNTATGSDVVNFKLYYTTTSSFATTNLLGIITTSLAAGSHSFTGMTPQTISNGSTGYFWITGDIQASGATSGRTITVSAIVLTDLSFSQTPTGSTSTTAGGTQTILALPAVITLAATVPTTSGATLNGTVNANGFSTSTYFNYGLTTSYSNTLVAAAPTPVTGSSPTAISLAVSGLAANTLYNFQAGGTNSSGPATGSNLTFTTLPNAPTVGTATAPTTTGFTANWTAPSPAGSATYTYTVDASIDNTFVSGVTTQTGIASGTLSFAFTTLSGATTYYYRVKAVNTQGNSAYSATSAPVTTSFSVGGACGTATIVDAPATPNTSTGIVISEWSKAPVNTIAATIGGTIQTGSTWQAMSDATNLYVLVRVKDANRSTANDGNNYMQDGVEIFLGTTSHTGAYTANDHQSRFLWNPTAGSSGITGINATTTGVTNWVTTNAANDGYDVAVKIPWTTIGGAGPSSGRIIGFDVNINDQQNNTGVREATAGWNGTNADDFSNAGGFGTATLTVCAPPTLVLPTFTGITNTSAILGATVTAINGGTLVSGGHGTAYNTTTGVVAQNASSISGTASVNTPFTQSRTGLSPQTQYFYVGYATRTNFGVNVSGTSPQGTFRTLSNPATAQATTLTGTGVAGPQINLTWNAAIFPGTGATTKGYLLIRAINPNTPSISNGNAAAPVAGANTTIISSTIAEGATSFPDNSGLTNNTTYNYKLIPFTWDGTNPDTYNYLTSGAPVASVSTCTPPSIISATFGSSPLCSNQTTTLTANGVAGTSPSVTWWTESGGSLGGGIQVGTGLTSDPVGAGIYYAFVQGTCGTAEAAVTVASAANTFTGSGNWTDNARWSCSAPPAIGDAVIIGAGANAILNTDFSVAGSLVMNATSTLTVNSANTLSISGTADFNGQSVIFKSDINGTASLGPVDGSLTGHTNVTVERYIPSNGSRSWRLLSVPTFGNGTRGHLQTVREAWQEGQAPLVIGTAGLGTQIIGTGTLSAAQAAGFDYTSNSASFLTWSGTAWSPVSSTLGAIANDTAYFLFIRGDRSKGVQGTSSNTSATTLRTNGTIYTGDRESITIPSGSFGLLGNLYPSAINFTGLTLNGGVTDAFYVWDSKASNNGSLGAYQTFSGTNGYDVTRNGSYGDPLEPGNSNTTIESGQGFFVLTDNSGSGTVTFHENSKITSPGSLGFRPVNQLRKIDSRLYVSGGNMVDANAVVFDPVYSNGVDGHDAKKLTNPGENFAILRDSRAIAVEGRQPATVSDVIPFKLWNLRQQSYDLEFAPANLGSTGLTAELEDAWLHTSVPVSLDAVSRISFTVDANAGSAAPDRFRLVFRASAPVPVSFISISANRTGPAVKVEWKVAAERNMRRYEVERSSDGRNFTTAGIVTANGTSTAELNYHFTDAGVPIGTLFYRVRSIGAAGEIKYTSIVKVMDVKPGFAISPNPAAGGIVNLQFNNQAEGRYTVRLLSNAGQTIFSSVVMHAGGNSAQVLNLPSTVARGAYQIEITAPDKTTTTRILFISSK